VRNYYEWMLQKFSRPLYPQDVYINELYGGLAQLDAGVTTVMDVSQIHHSPEHTDAAVRGCAMPGGAGCSAISKAGGRKEVSGRCAPPEGREHFASDDQTC
jgi:5-methylthioadenosine/S-adenosylhomocysteine deaminase